MCSEAKYPYKCAITNAINFRMRADSIISGYSYLWIIHILYSMHILYIMHIYINLY